MKTRTLALCHKCSNELQERCNLLLLDFINIAVNCFRGEPVFVYSGRLGTGGTSCKTLEQMGFIVTTDSTGSYRLWSDNVLQVSPRGLICVSEDDEGELFYKICCHPEKHCE